MIITILLVLAFIVWIIALFARSQGAAFQDIAFFAVGVIVLLCLLLELTGHFAGSNSEVWRSIL